ncbi:MAG: mechanosensitive ion channel [Parvularculaceae bacterium]|nr:mechanosensitive ion channel [Parvularculaceae bacterium]
MTVAARFCAALIAVLLAGVSLASAQDERDRARDKEIAAAAQSLSDLSEALQEGEVDDADAFTQDVREAIETSRALLAPAEAALRRAEESLALLGPAPKDGEPAEAPLLAADRKALTDRAAYFQAQRTRILANADEGARLLAALSQQRLEARWKRILRRDASLASPGLWARAVTEASALGGKVGGYFGRWIDQRDGKGGALLSAAAIGAAFAFSFLMFGPVRNWTRTAFTARLEALEPTPARRVAVAGVRMLTRVLVGVIGGFAVIETARAVGLLADDGVGVARAVWGALVAYLIVDGFSVGILSPSAPAWRLAGVDETRGRAASRLILAIVMITGVKSVFVAIAHAAGDAVAATRLATGIAGLIVGALLFALCLPGPKASKDVSSDPSKKGSIWPGLRFAGRILGVAMGAAAIAGHVNLADFAATRVYYLALAGAVLWFARAGLREALAFADRRLKTGQTSQSGHDPGAFNFWIGLGVDAALAMIAAPLLFLLAGFEWTAVRDLFARALIGFRIGGVVISLIDILLAIFTFVAILAGTRLLQSGLQRGPLAHSRMDAGVQNSLITLFGYAGLILAVVMGLSIAGVDLSNLALIAGALSVGIGFGLQSVVNNFVSGLILLFERPIKVGDWIITPSGEGIVRKISVRSTEIETFDRASIIVPNSELVAQTVTNWTHKDNVGRVRIPVGVAYGSDPVRVREILLECAEEHPLVVLYPEPFVSWEGFGASSLDFELRCFLSDIGKGHQVRTELRYAIFKLFKENGIEIPFPQQDIHVRSWPGERAAEAMRAPLARERDNKPPRLEPEDPDVADDD